MDIAKMTSEERKDEDMGAGRQLKIDDLVVER